MRAWIIFTLVRVGIFAAIFALLLWLLGPDWWWVAAISAALMAAAISFLALDRLRQDAAASLTEARERRGEEKGEDERVEDGE